MSIQFNTQYLREEVTVLDTLQRHLKSLNVDEDLVTLMLNAVEQDILTPEKAIEIATIDSKYKNTTQGMREMSSVGGGVTGGPTAATFTPGNGEQVASTKAFSKRKYQEDAPILAGGKKADLHTYTQDGFTQVKEDLEESRGYSQFKKQAAIRSKPEQMHQAVKMIHNKLSEITKLLEFTSQMKQELSEGEETVHYNHNTKKMFNKINSKVIEVYSKTKKLS